MDTNRKNAHGAVGFFLCGFLGPEATKNASSTCDRTLRHFPWLKRKRLQHGVAQLDLWSHLSPDESLYRDKSGNLFVLVGSPMNVVSWMDTLRQLTRQGDDAFELPWEGRCILIRISHDGKDWTMWNDWCSSIPVFHTSVKDVPVASSLEPAVVAAAGFNYNDFFKRGIVEMLVHGHFLGRDTLFVRMQTLPPDSVSHWRGGEFEGSRVLWTVAPSDSRWDCGWNELVDELHSYTVTAISDALKQHDKWILPISGGMDSRLIACIGVDQGVDFQAYTYGPATWNDPIYAMQVVQVLGIPWHRVDVGTSYLADYTPMWLDWFGSALHAHGMYQMPGLKAVREFQGKMINGFLGDPLGGLQISILYRNEGSPYERYYSYENMWQFSEITKVLRFDVGPIQKEIEEMFQQDYTHLRGAEYQRLLLQQIRNRQCGTFNYYQPMMYDYWKGVSTPYMNREYARFCLSLPRLALEERRLQKEMLKHYWPEVAKITGTYSSLPLIKTKQFRARRIAACLLPRKLRIGPLREFNHTGNTIQTSALKSTGINALYPLDDNQNYTNSSFLRASVIDEKISMAIKGDEKAYNSLRPLQTLIYRSIQSY